MGNRLILLAVSIAAFGMALGCSNSNSSGMTSQSVNLVGSKQGLAVGFVDVDGDGIEDKIVGAPYAASASSTGAVLVYSGMTSGYSSSNTDLLKAGNDNFGYSFVNLGDVDGDGKADFAISAIHGSGDDAGDTSLSGTVTIYKGGGNGRIIKKIGGDGPMDKFGYALAAGDIDGDGKPDIIVSAPFNTNDPALYQSGAGYVYFAPDFTTRVALYASTTNKALGLGVAAGDVNGDGIADLLIAASGKVLVYFGGTAFAPAINAPNITLTSTAAGFGKAIAVIGDLDGDGKNEIAIGAPNAVINNLRDTGSVFIVKGSATGLVALDTAPADLLVRINGAGLFNRFGASISSIGDVDGDGGKPDFAVGAPMADITTLSGQNILSGKVYLFKGKDITSTTTLANSTEFEGLVKNHQFGTSLAKSASGMLLIGAPRSNMDTGGVMMVDPATGQAVPGGSSGGATGGTGDCH
ncbi:MAG: FG-GAP-like repeat-containing protein [Nitrospirota bacterium]